MSIRIGITIIGLSAATLGGLYIMWRVKTFFQHPMDAMLGDSNSGKVTKFFTHPIDFFKSL